MATSPTIRGEGGRAVAQWVVPGGAEGSLAPLHIHAPHPATLTGQRTHVFTTGHSPHSSTGVDQSNDFIFRRKATNSNSFVRLYVLLFAITNALG